MRNGVDVSGWRDWAGLLSEDHTVVAALEQEIKLAGGSWMVGSEDLVDNVQEAMLPDDFNKFMTTPQDTIGKQRAATQLVSDLLKQGFSQNDVYTMVVGAYAPDTLTATLSNLSAYPMPQYFTGVYPTAYDLANAPQATLGAFLEEINVYSMKIQILDEQGELTGDQFDQLYDGVEQMLSAHRALNNATAAEQQFAGLSEDARTAVRVAQAEAQAEAAVEVPVEADAP